HARHASTLHVGLTPRRSPFSLLILISHLAARIHPASSFTISSSIAVSPFPSRAGVRLMLPADQPLTCPECEHGPDAILGRRDFIRVLVASAATAAVAGLTPLQKARAARAEKQAAAEQLVFELFGTMDSDQKK